MRYIKHDHIIETEHLTKRIKERAGIPKRAQKRFLQLFMEKGKGIEDFDKDDSMHVYLSSIQKNDYILWVYNGYVLVTNRRLLGITLLIIPREMRSDNNGKFRRHKDQEYIQEYKVSNSGQRQRRKVSYHNQYAVNRD